MKPLRGYSRRVRHVAVQFRQSLPVRLDKARTHPVSVVISESSLR